MPLPPSAFRLPPSAFILFLLTLLAGCGFHLRGQASLPYESLYISGYENSALAAELKRNIRASHTRVTDNPNEAQAILQLISVTSEKYILSLSGGGRVREYQLRYRVWVRLQDNKNRELIPAREIFLKRDFSFNDTQVLAKESEEALLYRDMQNDAVQQILRQIAAVKP